MDTIALIKQQNYKVSWLKLYRGLLDHYRVVNLSQPALYLKALIIAHIRDKNITVKNEDPENIDPDDTSEKIIVQANRRIEELENLKLRAFPITMNLFNFLKNYL